MAYSGKASANPQSSYESDFFKIPLKADTSIYKGNAVFVSSGKAHNGLAENDIFVGICSENAITGVADKVEIDTKGIFPFATNDESVTIGSVAYIDNSADNGTITTTAPETGLKVAIGNVIFTTTSYVYIRVDDAIFNTVADVTPENAE